MVEQRRLEVLRAIVNDFVATDEPVGSKALLERHRLGVSAATIRNDMAALEDEGLITAPHTSAGRIPTDAGYRVFVDRLSHVKPMSPAERTAIRAFLASSVDLDDVVDRTVRLLSTLTNQVAVMQYPSLSRSRVRHVELVPLGGRRVLVVLILDTGRVEQRTVELDRDAMTSDGAALVLEIRNRTNAEMHGRLLSEAAANLSGLLAQFEPEDVAAARAVTTALSEALSEEREERVVMAGTANLTRGAHGSAADLGPVLLALEEHVVLLKLLRSLAQDAETVSVSIGTENPVAELQTTSVVSTSYGSGNVAAVGVLGPTRMDYAQTMSSVRAVARYLSEFLDR